MDARHSEPPSHPPESLGHGLLVCKRGQRRPPPRPSCWLSTGEAWPCVSKHWWRGRWEDPGLCGVPLSPKWREGVLSEGSGGGEGGPCWGPPRPEGRAEVYFRDCPTVRGGERGRAQAGRPHKVTGPSHGSFLGFGGGPFCGGDRDGGGYVEKGPALEAQVRPGTGASAPTPEAGWATTRSQIWAKLGCREGQARVRALGATWAGAGCCRTLSQDVRPCGVSWCLSCATAVLCGPGLSPSSL